MCIGNNSRLKSLSNNTMQYNLFDFSRRNSPQAVIQRRVTVDCHTNFHERIANVGSSSHFHIRAIRLIRLHLDFENPRIIASAIVGLRLDYICHCQFFAYCPSFSTRSEFLGASWNSLFNQLHVSFQFTSLTSDSETPRLWIGFSWSPFTQLRLPSILVFHITSSHPNSSVSRCLLEFSLFTSCQHCSRISWFLTSTYVWNPLLSHFRSNHT